MARFLDRDLLRIHEAPLSPYVTTPRQVLRAVWRQDANGRLTCQWQSNWQEDENPR